LEKIGSSELETAVAETAGPLRESS